MLWWWGWKRKESLQLHLWNLNICIEKVDAICWLAEVTFVMTSLLLARVFQCLFTLCLFPLCTDWWKYDSSVEPQGNCRWNSNHQRCSGKLFFFYPPRRQNALELARWLLGVRLYIQRLGERVGEKVWAFFVGCFHFTLYPIRRPNTDWGGGEDKLLIFGCVFSSGTFDT